MPRTIGFIGLGLMGTGFTKRLAATGHRVVGYDVDPDKREAARAWGVEAGGLAGRGRRARRTSPASA